jgi:predicted metal-dependent hydrolase
MAHEKIYQDPEIGTVTFRKSTRSSRVSIRVHPSKGVTVSVPMIMPYLAGEAFFKIKRAWIIETMARQKERYKDMPQASPEAVEDMRRRAKSELPPRLAELASCYGFEYNRVTIKHNATNWGSCSTKANINLNLNLVRLPQALRDYIMLHELCHLRHHDHGHGFHLLLEHVLTDNLLKLMDAGDADAAALARKAAASKAKYPVDHVCSRAIRGYRLV